MSDELADNGCYDIDTNQRDELLSLLDDALNIVYRHRGQLSGEDFLAYQTMATRVDDIRSDLEAE